MKHSNNANVRSNINDKKRSMLFQFLVAGFMCSINLNPLIAEPADETYSVMPTMSPPASPIYVDTTSPMPTMSPPVSPIYIDTNTPIPTMSPPALPPEVFMPIQTVMPTMPPTPPTMPCQIIFDRMNQIHATIMQERMNLSMISAQLNLETLMMNSEIESRSEFITLLANATDELAKIYYRSRIQILTDRIQSRQNTIEDLDYRESQKEIQISDLEAALERVRDQLRIDNCPNP
ncbi:MAG: hypothetical protein NT027_07180 [Proteobacteria bacterium]|nr:hypothetical protein [Pseudomonadota bacterium]